MKIYLVGGAVRDKLLHQPVKERDYVVVGATEAEMLTQGYQRVGKEFPVFLHPKTREEYALARLERKTGPGYKGFNFDASPQVTLQEDLLRRDLTINAMAEDEDGSPIDFYGGQKDIHHKVLRHVSLAFAEDPVRILRVGRFWARYAHLGFTIAPETISLMQEMVKANEVNALVAERVWKELERALGEKNPEKFFEALEQCGALAILFPKLTITGDGMKALHAACQLSADPSIRFAALMYSYDDDDTASQPAGIAPTSDLLTLHGLCRRYRAPNHYQQLVKMVVRYHHDALIAHLLSAEKLLNLFSCLDIFRRNERFENFLTACQAIANSTGNHHYNAKWLRECAQIAKAYPVQELISQGFDGAALAEQLKIERTECIAKWLKTHLLNT
jgi:tRNA nucleotidyltransferase (CCA-adding enzyme)